MLGNNVRMYRSHHVDCAHAGMCRVGGEELFPFVLLDIEWAWVSTLINLYAL